MPTSTAQKYKTGNMSKRRPPFHNTKIQNRQHVQKKASLVDKAAAYCYVPLPPVDGY